MKGIGALGLLGSALGGQAIGGATVNFASIFASGEQGFLYDPADSASVFQSNGGSASAADDPVGYMLDLSGNGNHLTEATNKPVLRNSGDDWWLEGNGTNTKLAASSFAWGTDECTLVFRVTKNDDTTRAAIASFASGSVGSWVIEGPSADGATSFATRTRGDGTSRTAFTTAYAAPQTVTLMVKADISAPYVRLYVDGVQVAEDTNSQGAGNFGTWVLALFMQNGGSQPFDGDIHYAFGVDRILTDAETTFVLAQAA